MATQRLSTWLALRCREIDFQCFLEALNEADAAAKARALCGVKSRSEIDSCAEAESRFHQFIRRPYQQYLQDPKNQTTQEK